MGSTQAEVAVSYDVDNEFFRLWLDERMSYTCALFDDADLGPPVGVPNAKPPGNLEQAQLRKLAWLHDAAHVTTQSSVLDIGCGWGANIEYLATARGVKDVHGITLSPAQHEEIKRRGLPNVTSHCVSYTDYKLDPVALDKIGGVLPGFSKWVYDITGYYEKYGFQARAAYRHRSAFKGEVVALFSNLDFTLIQPDSQLDAQVGYTFQPGSRLNGLGVLLQVSNVLNSPYRTYFQVNGVPTLERVEKYGRSWLLGASYHF